jgi:hypothetical protein
MELEDYGKRTLSDEQMIQSGLVPGNKPGEWRSPTMEERYGSSQTTFEQALAEGELLKQKIQDLKDKGIL